MLSTGVLALTGCGEKLALCFDPAGMGKGQIFARESREYVEQSKITGKDCSNCSLYSAEENTAASNCGKCDVDGLPAAATAYCTSWSA
ncbi:MAG: high-potential iron-sulfur protein [Cellvibrionaceae bacterium]